MKCPLHILIAATTLLSASVSYAGTEQGKADILPPPERPSKDWWFLSGGNTWITAVDGDVGFRRLTTSADTSMSEVLDSLDFAYMAHFEFGYKRWGIGLDGIYAKLSDDANYTYGPISGSLNAELEQAFVTARVQYRLVENESYTLDIFAGARWSYIDTDLDVHTSISFDQPALRQFNRDASRRFDFSEDWIDPIVGFRSVINLGNDWFLQLAGDVGGFGVGSDFTWQALGGVGYNFTPRISALLGYRALGIDYEKDNFKLDTISHGPTAALILKF